MQTAIERRRSMALRQAGYATFCIRQVEQELNDARARKAPIYIIRDIEQELARWQSEQECAIGIYDASLNKGRWDK